MRNKITCPNCSHSFPFSFRKNDFSSDVTCPHCKKALHVENRSMPYLIIAAILFLTSDYVFAFLKGYQLSSVFTYALAIMILGILCFLLFLCLKCLFGAKFVYHVKLKDFYQQQKEKVDQMKEQTQKKHKTK